ncbi:monosaccharide ABC transporter ATP-binding protein, CUT2 family [Arboricoccus pini]|uniref:Monosaccharide ABC transporter ATP-binding protein, CUT2 family n=1 Tax=Arboricoccus pini TaxID=1963835 RepID=A0A212RGF5_9PROT|nr:ATP-binding cassette domain-containing protein [Arboricoccus pini]SNB71466.1 monosaccharide ABC transporter ATP-binding protein, CUT2 family [Arboricoccus pini]
MTPFVQARGIGKSFGGLKALDGVDLDIHQGEVLALLGDNGAGKSTFVKILAGAQPQSRGEIRIEGRPVAFASPHDAARAGIATIYQELALSENLNVVENVFLGREVVRRVLGFPWLRRRAMRQRVDTLLRELDAHIPDPLARVGGMSGGQRQAVAIARALDQGGRLVIMDEPTAALAVAETRKVLKLVRQLAARNCAVILISHNIGDVFEVADRMAVFRRGRKIAERQRAATTPDEIVALITGAHPDARTADLAA